MHEYPGIPMGGIQHRGQEVPIVAFYSVQGGVGKSTLARKFAELVTAAQGRDGHGPNVLLIDLDVEAQGLTYRMADRLRQRFKTVHEVIAERNVTGALAITITDPASRASSNAQRHGELFLMPAARPEAKGLFDTLASIDKNELLQLLSDLIQTLVTQYNISCVVIDCAPGANPYTAAAATLADVPLLIGRNETATYEQIRMLPERFKEWYDRFQPNKQEVIINAVAVKDLYEARKLQYRILDYIPLTKDVIQETEGETITSSMRMLYFENFIMEIIAKVFVGRNHLIPKEHEVLNDEWADVLKRLCCLEHAPKLRRLRALRYLLWIGVALVILGIALIVAHQVMDKPPVILTNAGIACAIFGVLLGALGWYAENERRHILIAGQRVLLGGPEGIFEKLKKGASHRKELDEIRKLANTVPAEVVQIPADAHLSAEKERV